MRAEKDHYKVLGLNENATAEEIKKAYRRLARKFHPDLNPKRRSAERRFKEVQEAYDAISQSKAREYEDLPREWSEFEMTYEPIADRPRFWFVTELDWKLKLALVFWLLCTLSMLLPTNYMHESPGAGLIITTIPLILIFAGNRLAEDDDAATTVVTGSLLKGILGNALMFIGWVMFARLLGLMVIGPTIMSMI